MIFKKNLNIQIEDYNLHYLTEIVFKDQVTILENSNNFQS